MLAVPAPFGPRLGISLQTKGEADVSRILEVCGGKPELYAPRPGWKDQGSAPMFDAIGPDAFDIHGGGVRLIASFAGSTATAPPIVQNQIRP